MSRPPARSLIAWVRRLARRILGVDAAAGVELDGYRLGRLDYEGASLVVGVTSRREIFSRLRPVRKEPWTVRWIEEQVREGDVLWDVGANIGAYTLIAARRGARVVAVEPSYANFAALCDNVELNALEDRVTTLPLVLAASTALVQLEHSDRSAGATHRLATAGSSADRQDVLAFTLDELLERFELPAPSLLKLDVDGGEAEVLAGAMRTLSAPGFRSLLVEIEAENEAAVLAGTGAAGLELRARHGERDGVPLRGVWYGVFERG